MHGAHFPPHPSRVLTDVFANQAVLAATHWGRPTPPVPGLAVPLYHPIRESTHGKVTVITLMSLARSVIVAVTCRYHYRDEPLPLP